MPEINWQFFNHSWRHPFTSSRSWGLDIADQSLHHSSKFIHSIIGCSNCIHSASPIHMLHTYASYRHSQRSRCWVGVTLKWLPHEKSARGKITTKFMCLPLLKYRRPHKKSPHYRIAPPEKSLPGRQFTGNRPDFYRQIVSREETFLAGDPIMGHRPCSVRSRSIF